MESSGEMKSFGEPFRAPYPSPLTPAYVKQAAAAARDSGEVEEACRNFESYLIKMVMEEGEMRDLLGVEELLYCWDGLKSPVFIELLGSFYGELCRDLFSGGEYS
ncbi:hypothetical protein KSP40_PGU000911 [Platanthera guangdongensis]|uniref:OVATE domain-containing protein n=1 Tax=Platanthera guangdongensis TaxID=2320717 RepID=A0ABR2M8G4_9ASPA